MGMVNILMKERDMIMDRYMPLVKRFNLTEAEMYAKKEMQQKLVNLDFQIEQAKQANKGF